MQERLADEAFDVLLGQLLPGVQQQLLGGAELDDLAHVDEDDVVGHAPCLAQDVRYQHDGVFLLELDEQVLDDAGGYRVERRGGFVAEYDLGFDGQSACQAQALLLPDGEARGGCVKAFLYLVPEAGGLELGFDDLVQVGLLTGSVDARAVSDVIVDGHGQGIRPLREQAHLFAEVGDLGFGVVDVFAVYEYLAGYLEVGGVVEQAVERLQEGRFTAAGRANDGNHLLVRDIDGNVLQYLVVADADVQVLYADMRVVGHLICFENRFDKTDDKTVMMSTTIVNMSAEA